jgi:hypothetical protein
VTERAAPAGRPAGAASLRTRIVTAIRTTLFSRLPRLFFFAGVSVGLGIVMLVAKLALFVATPDWFLLANIVFASGAVGTKIYLLRRRATIRRMSIADAKRAERRAYVQTGWAIIVLSALYLLTLAPALLGASTFHGQELWSGIAIAVVAFTELILSLIAAVSGRRDLEPIASAIRRMNLATAIVLIALAQSALIAAVGPSGAQTSAPTALGFGTAAAVVGAGMLVRIRRIPSAQLPAGAAEDGETPTSPPDSERMAMTPAPAAPSRAFRFGSLAAARPS